MIGLSCRSSIKLSTPRRNRVISGLLLKHTYTRVWLFSVNFVNEKKEKHNERIRYTSNVRRIKIKSIRNRARFFVRNFLVFDSIRVFAWWIYNIFAGIYFRTINNPSIVAFYIEMLKFKCRKVDLTADPVNKRLNWNNVSVVEFMSS